jgi:hypothetical protein
LKAALLAIADAIWLKNIGGCMRTIVVVAAMFSFMVCPDLLTAQDCQECEVRRVMLYDAEVLVPRPFSNLDSIYTYWNYFFLAAGVNDYISNRDPSRDCVKKMDGAFYTIKDSVNANLRTGAEHANVPPPGPTIAWTDYLIYGTVSAGPIPRFTCRLEAATSREVVRTKVVDLGPGFDPLAIGRTVGASMGPIYATIMEFEKKKRDSGEPFAIKPKITLTSAVSSLSLGEKTTIEIFAVDCDGVPLKNRSMNLTVEGGTLDVPSINTDADGKATVQFTAGSKPTMATINVEEYPYQKPTGQLNSAGGRPVVIHINLPSDAWVVQGELKIDNTSTSEERYLYGKSEDWSTDVTEIFFNDWVSNINPLKNRFSSITYGDIKVANRSSYREHAGSHSRSEAQAGSIYTLLDDLGTSEAMTTGVTGDGPVLALSIYDKSYSFSINHISLSQTGGATSVRTIIDPVAVPPYQVSTEVSQAGLIKTVGLSVQGVNHDTSYTLTVQDSSAGTVTTTTTLAQQKFLRQDTVYILQYAQTIDENSVTTTGVMQGESHWKQRYTAAVTLTKGSPTSTPVGDRDIQKTLPASFSLEQNYPNPFNPSTTIRFALPNDSYVKLEICNIVGQKVAELVNGDLRAGEHQSVWNANVASGLYIYRLRAISSANPNNRFSSVKKMLLLR